MGLHVWDRWFDDEANAIIMIYMLEIDDMINEEGAIILGFETINN